MLALADLLCDALLLQHGSARRWRLAPLLRPVLATCASVGLRRRVLLTLQALWDVKALLVRQTASCPCLLGLPCVQFAHINWLPTGHFGDADTTVWQISTAVWAALRQRSAAC